MKNSKLVATLVLLVGGAAACSRTTTINTPDGYTVRSDIRGGEEGLAAITASSQARVNETRATAQAEATTTDASARAALTLACADAIRNGRPCAVGTGWGGGFWGQGSSAGGTYASLPASASEFRLNSPWPGCGKGSSHYLAIQNQSSWHVRLFWHDLPVTVVNSSTPGAVAPGQVIYGCWPRETTPGGAVSLTGIALEEAGPVGAFSFNVSTPPAADANHVFVSDRNLQLDAVRLPARRPGNEWMFSIY